MTRKPRTAAQPAAAAPPGAAGPAGAALEIQVGATALAALLAEDPPRGVPGLAIQTVSFQRAALGSPLDDVIVAGSLPGGGAAKLQMQVKRTLEFNAGDAAWKDVVAEIAASALQEGIDPEGLERAVAVARTTTLIETAYQQVLNWARHHEDAATFMRRLAIPRMANAGMRAFIDVFRTNLQAAGYDHDDETVWRLLRRFQILHFDFEREGSQSRAATIARLSALLGPADRRRAEALWEALVAIATTLDTSGGGITRDELVRRLGARGFAIGVPTSLLEARRRLAEISDDVLADIRDQLGGARLLRPQELIRVDQAFGDHRVVELTGGGGVGKSGIAKAYVMRSRSDGEAICLNEVRTPAPGWASLQALLTCATTREAFFSAVAASGGRLLFVDGIDRYLDAGKQATIRDLVSAALQTPGMRVLVTARADFMGEAREWFDLALGGERPARLDVQPLDDEDAAALAQEDAGLAWLLRPEHPAGVITRNLFQLSRLLLSPDRDGVQPDSEAALLRLWWGRGGGQGQAERAGRLRILRRAAADNLAGLTEIRLEAGEEAAAGALVNAETLDEVTPGLRYRFQHDVLRDWATAALLHEDAQRLDDLPLDRPIGVLHARGVELAARLWLEAGDLAAWSALLAKVSDAAVHPTWRRVVVLALTRSESAAAILERASDLLLADDGALLLDLIRLMRTVDGQPLSELLAAGGQPAPGVSTRIMAPRSWGWLPLIAWLIAHDGQLPRDTLGDIAQFLTGPLYLFRGFPSLVRPWVEFLFRQVWRLEGRDAPPTRPRSYRAGRDALSGVRLLFLAVCDITPELAERYVRARIGDARRGRPDQDLLESWGAAPRAAPAAFADYALAALVGADLADVEDEPRSRRRQGYWRSVFEVNDSEWMPPSPSRGGIFDLLMASGAEGLRLVEGLLAHYAAEAGAADPAHGFTIHWPHGAQRFVRPGTAYWSRGVGGTYVLSSIMLALEAWGHARIEAGHDVAEVVRDVVGAGPQPMGRLTVAVDLVLSHWDKARQVAASLLASPDLLAQDSDRAQQDANGLFRFMGVGGQEPIGGTPVAALDGRPSRRMSLETQFGDVLGWDDPVVAQIRALLEAEAPRVQALAPPEGMAQHPVHRALELALALLERENWKPLSVTNADGSVSTYVQFQEPPAMAAVLAPQREEGGRRMRATMARISLNNLFTGEAAVEPLRRDDALTWARALSPAPASPKEDFEVRQDRNAVRMAAAVLLREPTTSAEDVVWARGVLKDALAEPGDDVADALNGAVAYSPQGIAALGFVDDVLSGRDGADLDQLLALAIRPEMVMCVVFRARMRALAALRPELPQVLLGLGLTASLVAFASEAEMLRGRDVHRHRAISQRATALAAARLWLAGEPPPPLPDLPVDGVLRPRRRRRKVTDRPAAGARASWGVVDTLAAGWLSAACYPGAPDIDALLARYWAYTRHANGGDAVADDPDGAFEDGVDDPPSYWNAAYLDILAGRVGGLPAAEAVDAVDHLLKLPDGAFLTVMEIFLMSWDGLWMSAGGAPAAETYQAVRTAFAERFVAVRQLDWARDRFDRSIVTSLSGGVCALGAHLRFPSRPRFAAGLPRLAAMAPGLALAARAAPQSGFIADLFMTLIKDLHDPGLVAEVAGVGQAWLSAGQPAEFWADWGIGAAYVTWILGVASVPGGREALRAVAAALSQVLDATVRFGVPNAAQAEALLLALGSEG